MSEVIAKRFSENLRRYFEASDLSQEALAGRAEIHRTQVGDLLRGNQMPRVDTLIKLAGALGIEPKDLLEGMSWEPAGQEGTFKIEPPKK